MNVFNACIMHTAGTPRFGVEGAFKHRAENRRTDFRPVEIFARLDEKEFADSVGKRRNFDFLVCEKSAVDIREGRQRRIVVFQIRIAFIRRRVKNFKKINHRPSGFLRVKFLQIIVEHSAAAENAGVFRVKAEDKPHAKHVEAFERAGASRFGVLRSERVVDKPDDFTGGNGKFQFAFEVFVSRVDEKPQAVELLLQIGQPDNFRFAFWVFHVVDVKLGKVARNNPPRMAGKRQFRNVAFCLLKRIEIRAVGLSDGRVQIFPKAFLFNQNFCRRNRRVDKTCMIESDLFFKDNHCFRFFNAENIP